MAVMAGGFILYYKHTQKTIATLHQNNAKLEGAVESQKAAIESMDENFTKQSKLYYEDLFIDEKKLPNYDVSSTLRSYRRRNHLRVGEFGDWAEELEETVESSIRGIDVEVGTTRLQGEVKHLLMVVDLE